MKNDKLVEFKKNIGKIESTIGYVFRDKSLITQAFTRTSFSNELGKGVGPKQANEVLEFFGDNVLSLIIISLFIEECTERYEWGVRTVWSEGDFSIMKAALADKSNLSRSMKKLDLARYLLVGEGDKKLGIIDEPSVLEDLFESIVGAVYIDCDKDVSTVREVVAGILDTSAYTKHEAPAQNPKNALQEFLADKKRRLPAPTYVTLLEEGPDHKKTYTRGVYVGERLVASAKGKNQKQADLDAARLALEILTREEKG